MPHMVDDNRAGQANQAWHQVRQPAPVQQQLQVPATGSDALAQAFHRIQADAATEQDIEPQSAYPSHMQRVQFRLVDIGGNDRDPAQPVRVAPQRLQHDPVVAAIDADLHQHAA